MVSEFLSGMTRTSPKPHLMGLSVTNKPLIDEVNYQFARRISYVASTGLARGCLRAFADVLHALLSSCCCPPGCMVVCCYPSALLSGIAVTLNMVCVHQFPLLTADGS
jgi:hypothetical protein